VLGMILIECLTREFDDRRTNAMHIRPRVYIAIDGPRRLDSGLFERSAQYFTSGGRMMRMFRVAMILGATLILSRVAHAQAPTGMCWRTNPSVERTTLRIVKEIVAGRSTLRQTRSPSSDFRFGKCDCGRRYGYMQNCCSSEPEIQARLARYATVRTGSSLRKRERFSIYSIHSLG
jgi:hypothetical protein